MLSKIPLLLLCVNSEKHDEDERINPEDFIIGLNKFKRGVNGQNQKFVNLLLIVMLDNFGEKMNDDSRISWLK